MQIALNTTPCSFCHESVSLEAAKTDQNGKAMHEECYFQSLHATGNSDNGANEIDLSPPKVSLGFF
jgi:hypothetical protein